MLLWPFIFLGLALAITVSGGVLGAVLFLTVGWLAGFDFSCMELMENGFRDGGFLALIWAPGTSLVVCIMLAKKCREKST